MPRNTWVSMVEKYKGYPANRYEIEEDVFEVGPNIENNVPIEDIRNQLIDFMNASIKRSNLRNNKTVWYWDDYRLTLAYKDGEPTYTRPRITLWVYNDKK